MADPDYEMMANAFRRQARNVQYPDFKPKEDFPLWLAGYKEKVKNAFGYTAAQEAELKEEIVRSLSGKLQSGSALDAYHRLPADTKADYNLLQKALTNEFTDPQARNRFLDNKDFNKRKKDQSLKEFIQEIKKDQDRYSGMSDTVGVGAAALPNQEKIKDGIRRFKKGIRDRNGKVNKDQLRHLRYNIMDDADYSWENALMVASRWEEANAGHDSSSSSSSSSSSDEAVEAVECDKKKKIRKPAKKERVVINALEDGISIASLAAEVKTNARDLKGVKKEQEQMNANITSWRNETTEAINQLSNNVSMCCLQMSGNASNRNFIHKGSLNKNQQSGFRSNRNSPQIVKTKTPSATTPTATSLAATPAATATVAAALDNIDPAAQLLGAEGGESVTLPMDYFLDLHARAGEEVCEEDFVCSLSQLYR